MYIKYTHKIERDDAFILRCLPRKIAIAILLSHVILSGTFCWFNGLLIKAVNIYCISNALN